MKEQPIYGKYPIDAIIEVEYTTKHGVFNKGDKQKVHPSVKEFLLWKGLIKDDTKKAESIEVVDPIEVKPIIKKETVKRSKK